MNWPWKRAAMRRNMREITVLQDLRKCKATVTCACQVTHPEFGVVGDSLHVVRAWREAYRTLYEIRFGGIDR